MFPASSNGAFQLGSQFNPPGFTPGVTPYSGPSFPKSSNDRSTHSSVGWLTLGTITKNANMLRYEDNSHRDVTMMFVFAYKMHRESVIRIGPSKNQRGDEVWSMGEVETTQRRNRSFQGGPNFQGRQKDALFTVQKLNNVLVHLNSQIEDPFDPQNLPEQLEPTRDGIDPNELTLSRMNLIAMYTINNFTPLGVIKSSENEQGQFERSGGQDMRPVIIDGTVDMFNVFSISEEGAASKPPRTMNRIYYVLYNAADPNGDNGAAYRNDNSKTKPVNEVSFEHFSGTPEPTRKYTEKGGVLPLVVPMVAPSQSQLFKKLERLRIKAHVIWRVGVIRHNVEHPMQRAKTFSRIDSATSVYKTARMPAIEVLIKTHAVRSIPLTNSEPAIL